MCEQNVNVDRRSELENDFPSLCHKATLPEWDAAELLIIATPLDIPFDVFKGLKIDPCSRYLFLKRSDLGLFPFDPSLDY